MPINHQKTNAIPDLTQVQLDMAIEKGYFNPGTKLADIVLSSDWNATHTNPDIGDINGLSAALTALAPSYRAVTGNTTITTADINSVIFCDTSAGDITVTLLDGAGIGGKEYTVIKTADANNLIFSGETVNGTTAPTLTSKGSITFISDNTNLWIK